MSNHKIFVVDDNLETVQFMEAILATEGYEISVANDGKTGLEMIKRTKPDLVLLDVMMPEMDGYEVLKRLKEDPSTKEIPVIMVTARDLDHEIQKGLKCGADDYTPKPFHIRLFMKKIQNILRRSKNKYG